MDISLLIFSLAYCKARLESGSKHGPWFVPWQAHGRWLLQVEQALGSARRMNGIVMVAWWWGWVWGLYGSAVFDSTLAIYRNLSLQTLILILSDPIQDWSLNFDWMPPPNKRNSWTGSWVRTPVEWNHSYWIQCERHECSTNLEPALIWNWRSRLKQAVEIKSNLIQQK